MSKENPTTQLQQLKDRIKEAVNKKDSKGLTAALADDFNLIDFNGRIVSKQQLIDGLVHSESQFPQIKRIEPTSTQTLAKGTLVREVAEIQIKGKLMGLDLEGYYVFTGTYLKSTEGWQVAGATLTGRALLTEIDVYYQECMRATREKDRAGLEKLFHEHYYLVDDRGNVFNRDQMIDSVVHSDTNFAELLYHDPLHAQYQADGDTVREVREMKMKGKYVDPNTNTVRGVSSSFIYTATYVRSTYGQLRVLSNTMTKK
jgi:hypothetical protein